MNIEKLKLFIKGRKGLLPKIEAAVKGNLDIIWFHVPSYGEFEEARPVIEATRARFPEGKILLTFFSPTGFIPLQHYDKVDWVFYIPLDTPWDMKRFLDAVRPSKVIFTITDFWPVMMNMLRRRKIDTYIMSVHVEPDSYHLSWWDFNYRQIMRNCYNCVMVRDQMSYDVLTKLGVPKVKITGDPRLDRVADILKEPWSNPVVDAWCKGKKVFMAGSTFPAEDEMMLKIANSHPDQKIMIIPHETDPKEVDAILAQAQHGAVRYTDYEGKEPDEKLLNAQILVINTVGMLARLYRYGFASLIGGGFTDNMPHSVVEPAVFGMPISFGPVYGRESHCRNLTALGAAFPVKDQQELEAYFDRCISDHEFVEKAAAISKDYVLSSTGATHTIVDTIFD
jgi:3-deoxy-D-manno-octulosonic-acid transferase